MNLTEMFKDREDSTWLFIGGADIEGGFSQTGFIRNFTGHFEEYVRWTISMSENGRQRYVFNAGKSGAGIQSNVERYVTLSSCLNPLASVYCAGIEDFEELSAGTFSFFLRTFITKALSLHDHTAFCVLQSPHAFKSPCLQEKAMACHFAMEALIQEFDRNLRKRILLIPICPATNHPAFLKDCLNENDCLSPKGHMTLAKLFLLHTYGSLDDFPVTDDAFYMAETKLPGSIQAKAALHKAFRMSTVNCRDGSIRLTDKLNSHRPLTWLFLGDSITHGALHTHGLDSLHQLVEKYIREDWNRRDDIFLNTGVSGATTQSHIDHLKIRMTNYKADIAVLMFGMNDADESSCVSESLFEQNIEFILDTLKPTGAVPVLRTPNPLPPEESRAENLRKYADIIRSVAKRRQILLVDHYSEWEFFMKDTPELQQPGHWNGDSIHPNFLGQLQMTQSLLKILGLWKPDNSLQKEFSTSYLPVK